ncbi:U11/U12 small nuclear ribonucleoprotein 65 kDa protein-like isoform X2 [Salvia splendens]|uniref:U11/U12 small nuclear ribonucleoprotein 65 kDa protein-like isoform X2 n=1 Tax=Salvia splendens TaxID=180675 RepID=UPI001C27EB29|nr:U11/U12 small nuclear ribonucleoprotein 65 kDa protein-like isoform X2 [Salvia splendens]
MQEAPPPPITHQLIRNSLEESQPSTVTLLVRHLPEAIPHDTLTRLFSHYGASSVRPFSHGRVKNCAFVDFKDEFSAYQAQKQLHGLRFLGKVMSVERANKGEWTKQHDNEREVRKDAASVVKDVSSGSSTLASEPIAQKLGIEYPFPPHLEYAYPPPDGNILTNIVNALIAVPRFYTQVLHLMNKMNIPAPFRKALPTPPLPEFPSAPPPPPPPMDSNMEYMSSSESEMESSDEEVRQEARPKRKRAKKQAIVGPAVDKDVAHEAVGLKQVALVPKEKPIIKKKNPVLQIRIAQKQNQPELQDNDSAKELQEPIPESSARETFATTEELNNGKLPPEEILSLPKFKNYTAGDPTPVLYIKNLAKDVVVDDFYFIFGSFFGSIDAAKFNLAVKLMQEGRMRGQAFVTFPTVELARNALCRAQ